jgi:benzoate membrane transport protein
VPAIVVPVAVLTIVVGAASAMNLADGQLLTWALALYSVPGILGVWLALRHRQPLVLTGNVFAIILFASDGGRLTFAELAGASVVAGIAMAVLAALGLTMRVARLIPLPIVLGTLAGAVLPFVVRIFSSTNSSPIVAGGMFLAFLAARRGLGQTAGLPVALVAGLALAAASGQLLPFNPPGLPVLSLTIPTLSIAAVATVAPVLLAIMTVQSNVPSLVFVRSQGYEPPEREVDLVSGVATVFASILGPNAVSMPLPLMGVVAGPDAGSPPDRYRTAVVAGIAVVMIGVLTTVAVALLAAVPPPLIQTLAGLALLGVLASAVRLFATGPLMLGPILAMVVAQSSLTLLGLGPLFWALVIGIVASAILEPDALRKLSAPGE